jgi:2-polyprenyl-3-methyl-5-hydroxy-6-metoxy-1,4-benzoquinol methylase
MSLENIEYIKKSKIELLERIDCLKSDIMDGLEVWDSTNIYGQVMKNVISKDYTLLDIGCGDKRISKYIIEKLGFKRENTKTIDAWPKSEPDYLLNLVKDDLPTERFNVILMLDFIEHLPKERGAKILEQAKDICLNKIILLTPLVWSDNISAVKDTGSWYHGNSFELHKSLWTIDDFEGWERIDSFNNYFFGVWNK